MNLLGAGLPCVIAVIAVHLITLYFGLPRPHHLLLTLSFTLATIAPAYARFVNNHMMLLAVCAVLTLEMLRSSSFANPLPPALRGERVYKTPVRDRYGSVRDSVGGSPSAASPASANPSTSASSTCSSRRSPG